jgi:hypothetical protein
MIENNRFDRLLNVVLFLINPQWWIMIMMKMNQFHVEFHVIPMQIHHFDQMLIDHWFDH